MGVSNGGGGGGSSVLQGTLAARPATGAVPAGTIYFATDNNEISVNNPTQTGWNFINRIGSAAGTTAISATAPALQWGNAVMSYNNAGFTITCPGGAYLLQNSTATLESATATAGTAGAPPAQVRGYFIFRDSTGTGVKVPYYAV